MATYGRGMTIDGSRLANYWPTACVTAWLAVWPLVATVASDFDTAGIAAQPVLVPYSDWQPPTSFAALATEAASEPWQPPREPAVEAEPATEAEAFDDETIELTLPSEPPVEQTTEPAATADEAPSTLSHDDVDQVNSENDEYFAALDADLTDSFAAPAARPLPVRHAPLPSVPLLPSVEYVLEVPVQAAAPPPAVTPYSPTTAELTRQLLPSIRHAYGLARRGAVYAARTEFIRVLRRIAQSKDAAANTDVHSHSLAAALRALDEADDFAPQGAQLEGEMDVNLISAAHRTPVLQQCPATPRPVEAIALYHEYARHQFARAVAGEQAGSAALYGLGKMHNRLASGGNDDVGQERQALVLFLAALDVAPGNHLAANEVGVLLARGGRPWEASIIFRHAIDVAPTATTYHNLAVVDRQLGYHEQASANELYAQQLAARDRAAGAVSQANGVRWVAPQDMSRTGQPLPIEANQNWAAHRQGPPPPRAAAGQVETAAKWPNKLIPGFLRR